MENKIYNYLEKYSTSVIIRRNFLFFFIFATFSVMLILNFNTGYMADDYSYITSTSFLDVLKNEYHQYLTWGGRSVVHILARIFLMLPKFIFNIANSLVYTWLTVLIYLYSNYGKKPKVSLYLFIVSCCFIFIPAFGQTVIWVTGSCNYLWGTTIILTFLLPYRIYITKNFTLSKYKNLFFILFMFCFGVIAGWCNENTSGGGILFVILMMGYCFLKKIKIKGWLISGLCGTFIGFAFMILAPGNAIRAGMDINENTKLVNLFINFIECTNITIRLFIEVIILFFIFIVIHLINIKNINKLIFPLICFLVGIAVIYAMILSPRIDDRAFFGASIFLIISVSSLFSKFDLETKSTKAILYTLTTILLIQYTSLLFNASIDIISCNNLYKKRLEYVQQQKQLGNLDIILPEIMPTTKYNSLYGPGDIRNDPEHWINDVFKQYYQLNSVKTIPYDEWIKIKNETD